MPTIQAFLTVILCGFIWLTIVLGLALAGEVTIYGKDWKAKERNQDGRVCNQSWLLKDHIQDGRNPKHVL